MAEDNAEIKQETPSQNGGNEQSKQEAPSGDAESRKLPLITRQDGHRAPMYSPWITDEELWFIDWAFRDTVRQLMKDGIKFELKRYEGTPNFPPLLLQKGYGVALCVRRTKAASDDVGPIQFDGTEDERFLDKLCILANDVTKARFRHADLIFSIRITTFFEQRKPANAPPWWNPDAEMDRDECEFSTKAEADALRGSAVVSPSRMRSPPPKPPVQGPQESLKVRLTRSIQERVEAQRNPPKGRGPLRIDRRDSGATERRPWRPAG